MSRNAPPVAGAVSWARQLLRRVEEPMVAFKQEGSVLQSKVRTWCMDIIIVCI